MQWLADSSWRHYTTALHISFNSSRTGHQNSQGKTIMYNASCFPKKSTLYSKVGWNNPQPTPYLQLGLISSGNRGTDPQISDVPPTLLRIILKSDFFLILIFLSWLWYFLLVKDGICEFQHDGKGHKNVKVWWLIHLAYNRDWIKLHIIISLR